jgi:hypothetical protein
MMTREDIATAAAVYGWIWEGERQPVVPPPPEDLLDGEQVAYITIIKFLRTKVELEDELREIRLAVKTH